MPDYQLLYKTSFYMVAAIISIAAIVFVVIEGWLDRRQTRIYLLMLFDVLLSAVGGIVYKLSRPYAVGNSNLTSFMLLFQFLDFFAHTALAPLFYVYIQNVIGAIHRRSLKKRLAFLIPFFICESMVLLNPIIGWIYYFDENYDFHRNWGEVITYIVATFYFALSMFDILFYWHAVNKRRRQGLLYCFLITLSGIIIQLISINLSVELVAESMGLMLIMLVVEREEDRIDQSTRTYNRSAFQSDINNFFRIGRKFHIIYIRILNDDILQRLTGSTDDDILFREIVKYLRQVHSKYEIYRVRSNAFLLVCHGVDDAEVSTLAKQINDRFAESFDFGDISARLKVSVLYASIPLELTNENEIMLLIDSVDYEHEDMEQDVNNPGTGYSEYENMSTGRILHGSDISRILYSASLEKALHRGLSEHNYEVHYQPIYNIRDKSICGAEASICLNDPELGIAAAERIMPLAGKQGIDILLNNMLLDEVCMFMGSGIPLELGLNQISVAISVKQCIQPYFVDMLDRLLNEYNVVPSMFNFEVPEPEDAEQATLLEGVMKILKDKGFTISLDSFGTGYTNMKAFSNFGYDIVNLNIGVLGKHELNDAGKIILKYSIRMIRDMNMRVLVKGATGYDQVEWIEQTDASYLQTDYYSRVITQSELISILRVTEIARRDEQRARAGSEAKSNFLANMSHEIRTPINAILGMNEMILRESKNEAVINYAKDIEHASRSLLALINNILDFSKLEAGNMEIVPVEYDLSSLLNDVINMTKMRIELKGLKIDVDVETELPEKLFGDEMRIRQVLLNLLDNAIKNTEEGSIGLNVRGSFSSDHSVLLIIDVKDTGTGIKEEDKNKLMERIKKQGALRDKSLDGMGLGLTIAGNLLNLMEGAIQIESVYGKGSTFTVVIPQQVMEPTPIGDFNERFVENTLGNPEYHEQFIAPEAKILVVDDTPINLTVIKSLLKNTQIHIDTALSGKEGLEMCAGVHYDIIFLDYRMPEMDGVTILKIMREMSDHPNVNTPIILLTANALSGAREQFMAEGFDDYMTKPIDGRKLETLLMRYLPKDKVILNANQDTDSSFEDRELMELLRKNAGLDVEQGLSNCGSLEGYLEVLKIYLSSVESKVGEIEKYLRVEDYDNYTIQVHSLKSTSKVIGAIDISERAYELEQAGDEGNVELIRGKTEGFLDDIRQLGRTLSDILDGEPQSSDDRKELPEIEPNMLRDAYKTLSDFAMSMDYENSIFVLDELKNYKLKEEDERRINSIRNAIDNLDWDEAVRLMD